ncbi:MAG: methyltransferase domain-containing protein [Deltaproteobacteria bacterium]|nr:methyltransferase domain-containing protein [Deltaproteobacteria bacterium]
MEKITDWILLWKELVERQGPFWNQKKRSKDNQDKWKDRSKMFYERVKERWSRPDPHRDIIISMISSCKNATVLDIGAGTGAWAVLLSKYALKVTAIEPSADMRELLMENLDKECIRNVEVLDRLWPVVGIEPHDFTLASHSIYGCDDIRGFITAMNEATRNRCLMLLRAPDQDGLMAMAADRIWGLPYDSPNFQVAYNAMLQMGMFPNVLMEKKGMWPVWTDNSLDDALDRIMVRFELKKGSDHDQYLTYLLKKHLTEKDGKLYWPSSMRTGLLYWDTKERDN